MVRTKLSCAFDSHPGLVRTNNEDRVYCDVDRGIFLVIDGVGGQAAGERAASIAETRIRRRLERQTGTPEERVREAITVANNEILDVARANPEFEGMACVLTVALIEDGVATVGHVGDSRLYKIRGSSIRKITHDHSPIGEREESGELSEADAMRHPRRNEVYRDVGSEEHAPDDTGFIEVRRVPFEPDSALLLCSDGLSDQVGSREIYRTVLHGAADPQQSVRELIEAANMAGGKDNVSIIIVQGEQFPSAAAATEAVLLRPRGGFLTGRAAFFLYGALAALLAVLAARLLRTPSPPQPPPRAEARLLTVGKGAPYATIGEAMAKAAPGDTVEVLVGEYREAVELKSGVTLRSRVPGEAILRAAPPSSGKLSVAVTAEGVRNCRIIGFRILADQAMPLSAGLVLSGADVEVADMEISGARTGVRIQGGTPVLRANSIHDNAAEGIVVEGDAVPWFSHNTLLRNGRDPKTPRPDIAAAPPSRPVFLGNVFDRRQAVSLPPGTDPETLWKYNYLVPAEDTNPPARRTRRR
jgi:serine/threonine protein phosphatase PrpC